MAAHFLNHHKGPHIPLWIFTLCIGSLSSVSMFPSLLIFIYCFAVGGCFVLLSVNNLTLFCVWLTVSLHNMCVQCAPWKSSHGCSCARMIVMYMLMADHLFTSTDVLCCWQTVSFPWYMSLGHKKHSTGLFTCQRKSSLEMLSINICFKTMFLMWLSCVSRDYQKLKPKFVAPYTPDIFVPEWQLPFTNPARYLEVGQLTNPWLVQ